MSLSQVCSHGASCPRIEDLLYRPMSTTGSCWFNGRSLNKYRDQTRQPCQLACLFHSLVATGTQRYRYAPCEKKKRNLTVCSLTLLVSAQPPPQIPTDWKFGITRGCIADALDWSHGPATADVLHGPGTIDVESHRDSRSAPFIHVIVALHGISHRRSPTSVASHTAPMHTHAHIWRCR